MADTTASTSVREPVLTVSFSTSSVAGESPLIDRRSLTESRIPTKTSRSPACRISPGPTAGTCVPFRSMLLRYRPGRLRSPASSMLWPLMGAFFFTTISVWYILAQSMSIVSTGIRFGSSHREQNMIKAIPRMTQGRPMAATPKNWTHSGGIVKPISLPGPTSSCLVAM